MLRNIKQHSTDTLLATFSGSSNTQNASSSNPWTKHEGATAHEVSHGLIVCRSGLNTLDALLNPTKEFDDFELKFEIRGERINSDLQIHSKARLPDGRELINGPKMAQGPGQAGYMYGKALKGG